MNWTEQRRPGEYLVEWGAPAVLAAAIGWAAYAVSGAALAGAAATALALVAGAAAMRRAGEPAIGIKLSDFAVEPVDAGTNHELLLDDPLREVAPDSRVAAMFEAEPETPGALVARIADYLGERSPQARPVADEADGPVAADAGAGLHAALANIRASLR